MNHRALQRTLFRMQLDPGFAARLRSGDPDAAKGLGVEELGALRALDPAAVSADQGGRRREQFLRNVSEEFALACAAGVAAEGFPSSAEFHDAVQSDASLPLAFGRYAERCSAAAGGDAQRALLALEQALARARRELRAAPAPAPGELALAPRAWLVPLAAGTLELAARLRESLDRGAPGPELALGAGGAEFVLVLGAREREPFRLRAVELERVSPELARLLEAAQRPHTLAGLARAIDAEPAELEPVVEELVRDAVLVAG